MGELEELYERHQGAVAFFIVYIREAHPEDGWVLADTRRDGIELADPVSLDERAAAADACALRLETRIPILAYHFAWPGFGHIAKTGEGFHYYPEAMNMQL